MKQYNQGTGQPDAGQNTCQCQRKGICLKQRMQEHIPKKRRPCPGIDGSG